MKQLFLVVLCSCFLLQLSAQDTIRYYGYYKLSKKRLLLVESIELYPDSTFKWASEYDLSWSEYGKYELNDGKLQLDFLSAETFAVKRGKTERYRLKGEKMHQLNKRGFKKRRKKDKSIKTFMSWFPLHRQKYFFKKVDENILT